METKDKQDEAQRHAQRDALIHSVFIELVYREGYSVMDAYIFLGRIWGLGERKLQQIVGQPNKYALSADDLTKLAVLLHRISLGDAQTMESKITTSACHDLLTRTRRLDD